MQITTYTAMPSHTTFLYPESRQYPVDEICEKIVRSLEKRNWKIPGIQVEFDDSGTGEEKYRRVSKIKGEDFKLWFCRIQGRINQWKNNIAAINELVIPRRELNVHEDESGPTYYTYVGDNWEEDKKAFMDGCKIHSKLDGKARTYLQYTGRCGPLDENGYSGQSYLHKRNPYLVNDDDLGREYKAGEGEPKYFHTDQVFQEFKEWLNANVLQKIEAVEETSDIEMTTEPGIPYPEHVGPFYMEIDWKTYDRIVKGKEDKDQLEPSQRYALIGGGDRLVSLSVRNDESIPMEAYDGFKYCSLEKPELEASDSGVAVLRINPRTANNIFVVDFAAGIKYKQQCSKQNFEESLLTDEEYKEYQRCTGRTIVPIHQYKGNYEMPVVLIGSSRELSFDEVVIVESITQDLKQIDDCVIS